MYYILISFFLSFYLLRYSLPVFRSFSLAQPNNRSSHSSPTPTGLGLVFVLFTILASLFLSVNSSYLFSSLLFLLPLSVVGFIDDIFDLSIVLRFTVQFLTAFYIVFTSPLFQLYPFIFLFVLLFLIVVAVINFTNFIDCLDGLLASCSLIVFLVIACTDSSYSYLYVLVGALTSFLTLNWAPSRAFMGDVGSTFLGALFVFVCMQSTSYYSFLSLFLLMFPILVDPFFCVLRRIVIKENLLSAHRLHLAQRLHLAGWSHSSVALVYIASTIFVSLVYLNFSLPILIVACMFVLAFYSVLDYLFAARFEAK